MLLFKSLSEHREVVITTAQCIFLLKVVILLSTLLAIDIFLQA